MKTDSKLIGVGLLASIAASFYCITTLLALVAGASGLASTFSWLEPFRPYFVGLTVLVLGFAWYQKLKSPKPTGCKNKASENLFVQTKMFLGIVTGISILLLAFPLYSHIFSLKTEKQIMIVDESSIQTAEFTISGLTCTGAELVDHEVIKLDGTIKSTACHEVGNAIVAFDHTKTNLSEIERAINSTGYTVTGKKVK